MQKILALFETTLASSISSTATTSTLSYGKDKLGNDLSGSYGFIYDEGTTNEEFVIATATGTAITDMQRGISPVDGSTAIPSLGKPHRKTCSVKITDFPILGYLVGALNGTIEISSAIKYASDVIITDPAHLVNKAYADAIGVAGITGFLVQSSTGKTVNINSGTYIKNGEVLTYAGASGTALSTGDNYIEFKDGAISINQTAFTNDSYSLALVVCSASAITSNTDKRSFINITDLRTDTNGTLLTGAVISGMRVYTGWTGITNGSFRATIDGVAWNFDAINFSTATSITDIATLIQTKIRAITGASEVVSYSASTFKFTITSGTTGTESQISVLATSTGTVGTDISGANYLNGASGTATQGTGNFIGRDSLGLFGKIGQGLKIIGGYLLPKLKSGGGILSGADGLYVDSGTTANKIVQLDANAKLPAIDISQGTGLSLEKFIGAGDALINKTFWNYQILFSALTTTTSVNWSSTQTTVTYKNHYATRTVAASNYVASEVSDPVGTALLFSGAKKVIAEWCCKLSSVGTNNVDFGFADGYGGGLPYNDAGVDAAIFTVANDGKLYAHTSTGAGGAAHTEVEITGITLTNVNTFRIEWNPTASALFYVNGVLKATITTNLPNSANIYFRTGSVNTTNFVNSISAPYISVEK